jgi:hypothetical protein
MVWETEHANGFSLTGDGGATRVIETSVTFVGGTHMRLRNLAVAPVARLVKSERLARPVGHFRAEFAVAGMVCSR